MKAAAGDSYWDQHVGPSNLPGGRPLTAQTWVEEIQFYMTAEQQAAYGALGPLRSRWIIEIGSGVGVNTINLARHGARVAAVDSSWERLAGLGRVAAEMGLAASVYAVCARAEHLPFRADMFDGAYTKSVLIHCELGPALGECRRVLRRGGKGVFCEPTRGNPFAWLYRRFFAPHEWRTITRYFGRKEEQAVADGFGNLRVSSFYFMAFLAFYWQFGRRNLKRFRRWLGVLGAIDRALFAVFPPLRRLAWFRVYVVEKRGGE